jgi:hypothetical protein
MSIKPCFLEGKYNAISWYIIFSFLLTIGGIQGEMEREKEYNGGEYD